MMLELDSFIFPVVVVLACAILIYFVGRKIKLPLLIGYFITGIIVGPYALGLVEAEQVSMLAEFGVIFLMFTIGLEVSIKTLIEMKKIVLIAGTLQLLLTCGATMGIMMLFGFAWNVALFIGFLVAHSSTAIIMNIYQKSGEIDKEHGKVALGILIFQDLNVVPMMMLVPLLAGNGGDITESVISFVIGMVILVLILLAAVFIVPKILRRVALTRSREIFIISVIAICFGIAWLMSMNGVSLALGAFLAGVAISGTEFNHEVIGQISPLRDVFSAFFFVSVGMMLDIGSLASNILLIIALAVVLLLGKTVLNIVSVKAIGIGTGAAILSAIGLSQVGEFSFILGSTGLESGILTPEIYQIFLAISIITMVFTPFLCSAAPNLMTKYLGPRIKLGPGYEKETAPAEATAKVRREHVIIVGYGLMGRSVVRALTQMGIDYVVLETNARTVAAEKAKGIPIAFGDASRESVLESVDIKNATSIVLTIPDRESSRTIISIVRRLNPSADIIVRALYLSDTIELYRLGADEVIVDEKESGVRIFKRLLSESDMTEEDMHSFEKKVRNEVYDRYIISDKTEEEIEDKKRFIPGLEMEKAAERFVLQLNSQVRCADVQHLRVGRNSDADGKTVSDLNLRTGFGISLLAVKPAGNLDSIVSPDRLTVLHEDDIVVLMGSRKGIAGVIPLFAERDKAREDR
ncbi:MAG TPA: cation:proton antiporter [Methanocorpusculum sp.]|nr:cation:proton antiporter [Methanocorpusculum sp.]